MEEITCTWCEEATATHHGYDEHNGPWHLCDDCWPDSDVAQAEAASR